jgi:hypothetical protein
LKSYYYDLGEPVLLEYVLAGIGLIASLVILSVGVSGLLSDKPEVKSTTPPITFCTGPDHQIHECRRIK